VGFCVVSVFDLLSWVGLMVWFGWGFFFLFWGFLYGAVVCFCCFFFFFLGFVLFFICSVLIRCWFVGVGLWAFYWCGFFCVLGLSCALGGVI